ncbi:hypothetical protein [Cohnella yongneupensis]|uniref:Type 4 fimbrial biogenesis protein PilX N-terminal domain-containing protein n=1 Tax=Cohnella yongneupensis TaxID=425006 RepID=A0ABW0R3D4_9BACL
MSMQQPTREAGERQTVSNPSARRMLGSERGAALILAMLTVIVMTMMGLVLLDVLKNSNIQVAASESGVQAESLAQKGLDETLSLIKDAVNQANGTVSTTGGTIGAVIARINAMNDEFRALPDPWGDPLGIPSVPGNLSVAAEKGTYQIHIEWEKVRSPDLSVTDPSEIEKLPYPLQPYVMKLVVTSKGTIPGNGPKRSVTKQMEVYVSTINPVFRYPVSSGLDLKLNGFSYIVGDVYVGEALDGGVLSRGKLIYSDEALFSGMPGSLYGKETNLPALKGFVFTKGGYEDRRVEGSHKETWSSEYFSKAYPFEDRTLTADETIPVSDYVGHYAGQLVDTDHPERLEQFLSRYDSLSGSAESLDGLYLGNNAARPSLPGNQKIVDQWTTIDGILDVGDLDARKDDLVVAGGVFASKPSAQITMNSGSLYIIHPEDDFLVAADLSGKLTLAQGQQAVIVGDVVLNDGFEMTGNMYVLGSLKIIGEVNINGTIYVNGGVELKEVDSINAATDQPLIVIASGKFDFSDNRTGDQRIHAFLYSELEEMNLYGVKNKMNILGGLHGNMVTLNAVGEDEDNPPVDVTMHTYTAPDETEETAFAFTFDQEKLTVDQSNLIVKYDDSLYNAPPDSIPTTDTLNIYVKRLIN